MRQQTTDASPMATQSRSNPWPLPEPQPGEPGVRWTLAPNRGMSLRFMPQLLDLFAPRSGPCDSSGLRAFRSLLLFHALVRTLDWVPNSVPPYVILGTRITLVIVAIAGLRQSLARAAVVLTALIVAAQ